MKSILYLSFLLFTYNSFCQNQDGKLRMTIDGTINTFYKYDAFGRISQIQQNDKKYYTDYIYLGDSMIVIQRKELIDSSLTDILLLNEKKLVDFKSKIYADNVFIFIKNEYNADDKLVLQTVESDVQKSRYEYITENGNTIKQVTYDTIFENGKFQLSKRIVNSVFSTKLNPLQKNITGFLFEENENKNLIITDTMTVYKSDFCTTLPCPYLAEKNETLILKYEYVFDEKGRIKEYSTTNTTTKDKTIKKCFYY